MTGRPESSSGVSVRKGLPVDSIVQVLLPFAARCSLRLARDSSPSGELFASALALACFSSALRIGEAREQEGLPLLGVVPVSLGFGCELPQHLTK